MNKYYYSSYSEYDAQTYAKKISKTVVIRSYENGNSKDERRNATKAESQQIEKAITAALWAIRAGHNPDSAKATAEYFILYDSTAGSHINTYDSVYIPINEFLRIFKNFKSDILNIIKPKRGGISPQRG